jgi:hypothetical protein
MWKPSNKSTGLYVDVDAALPSGQPRQEQPARQPRRAATPQQAHDDAHGPPGEWQRIRSAWPDLTITGPLTDEAIDRYAAEGRYSDAYKEALRAAIAKNNAERKEKDEG